MHRFSRRRQRSFNHPRKSFHNGSVGVSKCDEEHLRWELRDIFRRSIVARVSPTVVHIVSRQVPEEMAVEGFRINGGWYLPDDKREKVFVGSGFIIECEKEAADGSYSNTALTHAALFQRTNGVQPNDIKVDVYLSDDKFCKGEVFACDFHYNLAAVRFQSETPLPIAKLKDLDEVVTIDPAKLFCLGAEKSFELRPHSNLFKILPGEKLIAIGRCKGSLFSCGEFSSFFSMEDLEELEDLENSPFLGCRELCCVDGIKNEYVKGGPLVNYSGEVIGVMLDDSSFLPMNIVSRWWKHYKNCRQYRRPWIGFEVANLHAADLKFLEKFVQKFPNISAGILVTKVYQDSSAYCPGIQPLDVIVQCDGKYVRSTLEFFEKIWESRKPLKLSVLRASDGGHLDLTTTIGETTPDKFHRWDPPSYTTVDKGGSRRRSRGLRHSHIPKIS